MLVENLLLVATGGIGLAAVFRPRYVLAALELLSYGRTHPDNVEITDGGIILARGGGLLLLLLLVGHLFG